MQVCSYHHKCLIIFSSMLGWKGLTSPLLLKVTTTITMILIYILLAIVILRRSLPGRSELSGLLRVQFSHLICLAYRCLPLAKIFNVMHVDY